MAYEVKICIEMVFVYKDYVTRGHLEDENTFQLQVIPRPLLCLSIMMTHCFSTYPLKKLKWMDTLEVCAGCAAWSLPC